VLNLTKRVDYGLIALTHLAAIRPTASGSDEVWSNPSGECAPASVPRPSVREVAEAYHMSQPLLANVMKDLARLGFVRSVRGTKGGYELAVAPEGLSVGRVVEALEGPLRLTECSNDADHASSGEPGASGDHDSSCALLGSCLIKRSVWIIHAKIRDALYGVTIADLARQAGPAVRVRPSQRLPLAPASGPALTPTSNAGAEATRPGDPRA
jgi:Rrf2 family protein